MAEEAENSGGSFKNILMGLVGTITLAVGGFVTKQLTGEEETAQPAAVSAPAPVINITNSNQQAQQQAAGGKTVIIKEKAAGGSQPTAAPAPKPKKKDSDEFTEKPTQW
jgi:hypothetical protein